MKYAKHTQGRLKHRAPACLNVYNIKNYMLKMEYYSLTTSVVLICLMQYRCFPISVVLL